MPFFLTLSSNRTKVELKLGIKSAIHSRLRLPIEPKWNWNLIAFVIVVKSPFFQSNQSGIETSVRLPTNGMLPLPIEPKWNWNSAKGAGWYLQHFASNRTKVELKLDSIICAVSSVSASNRTKVELKHRNLFYYTTAIWRFQSNQSGIETKC